MIADFKKRFWACLILTLPILLLSNTIQEFFHFKVVFTGSNYVLLALASAVYIYGGAPFLKGFSRELKSRQPGMMTLVTLAITVAYVYSTAVILGLKGEVFYWELATLIDVMLLGHWLEMQSVLGASRALEELAELLPKQAHLIKPSGQIVEIPIEELKAGDRVLIRPGEKVPVDGEVVKGETSVNEAMLTGESKPVSKKAGAKVIGGSVNGEGSVEVIIEKTGKESYLAQVIELVKQAQASRSYTQDLANRAAGWLTWVAVFGGLITLVIWLEIGKPFSFALERLVSVAVIACPHALGLAIPLVVAVSTSLAASKGLLIRQRIAFEEAVGLTAVVFDKTGTLTEGSFGVTDLVPIEIELTELLQLAASLELKSEHPIARGIVAAAKEKNLTLLEATNFKALPGLGVQAQIKENLISLVGPGYIRQQQLKLPEKVTELEKQGKTVVFLLQDNGLKGAIALADKVRPESKVAVKNLKAQGLSCLMLTGDNEAVAKWVATELGLDGYFARVLPPEKAEKIKELKSKGFKVAMVGDGVNDAPALVEADVGIAIGAGTQVAIESADIVLVKNDPRDVATLLQLAKATYGKMRQNLFWATGYNVIALPLAAGVLAAQGVILTPALAALFMSLSTVIVAINAQRLR
jgi:Cu2+-exporting ATPase